MTEKGLRTTSWLHPTVSIIIRTKNEAAAIGQTLDRVFAQTTAALEVIVVDSGSTDDTLAIAQSYPVSVLHLDPQEWNYSRALNIGAAAAKGDILVCLSAHCLPINNDWLGNLLAPFADPEIAAVWGPQHAPGRPIEPAASRHQRPGTYTAQSRHWGLSNANSAVRRSLWDQFPFSEDLPAAEDKAWGMQAMSRGYSLEFAAKAGVWHEPHNWRSAFRRNREIQKGFLLMFPELHMTPLEHVLRLGEMVSRRLRHHIRQPNLDTIMRDLARVPSRLAHLIGGILGGRR